MDKSPFESRERFCPYCGVDDLTWQNLGHPFPTTFGEGYNSGPTWWLSTCYHCQGECIWFGSQVILVHAEELPAPHEDLPDDLKNDYLEARAIALRSPRGACALLRSVLEMLCRSIGGSGKTQFDCIGGLIKQGKIDIDTQRMLDAARVLGNGAVHAGQLDINDDREIATLLFSLVNEITDGTLGRSRRAQEVFGVLTQKQREKVTERDGFAC